MQNYDSAYYKNIEDKVFFLSVKEIKEYVDDRGWEYRAKPTSKAVQNSPDEDVSSSQYWYNWLRSPYASYSNDVRNVDDEGGINGSNANNCGVGGVRPALSLNLSSVIFKSGSGTKSNPFIITRGGTTP
ncbi:DUF6273 domain-containing protein [Natranaerovirga pectinivora]|uniref:DUF6273 domain-containing protein n=1 Tax=Natranaerovirga pectinivora TaxID=682400 RepID=UPI003530017C